MLTLLAACGDDGAPPPAASTPSPRPAAALPAIETRAVPALSPLTPDVVEHLRAIRARVPGRSDAVFAKVGDSATVSRTFLECFGDEGEAELGPHAELAPTVAWFRRGNAGGRNPFERSSLAAAVGWSTRQVLVGDPPPLLAEVRAINPRFAFALTGGNDAEGRDPGRFANRLLRVVDHLTRRGVIPILGSTTPRQDDAEAERWARRYDTVALAVARGHRLPFIDFHGQLLTLPRHGLAGDGMHPNVFVHEGATRPCDLTRDGLEHGANVRNLLALRTLDRLRRTVVEGDPALDAATPPPTAPGTVASPLVIRELPFTDLRSTDDGGSELADYTGCAGAPPERGPEIVYRFRLDRTARLRLWVHSRASADVDLHLLGETLDAASCVARDDAEIVRELAPGTHHLVVDSFVHDGRALSGDYLLVVEEIE
jgi:hypothetical protein